MSSLTKNEVFAIQVRRTVVQATQMHGTAGYPEIELTEPPFLLRLVQAENGGPCWYCPQLYGMRLVHLLESARDKGVVI